MAERTVQINVSVGLHARPAALLVQTARKFASALRLECNGKAADAKSIVGILSLAAGQGATVKIVAAGADETAAADTIAALIQGDFKENAPC